MDCIERRRSIRRYKPAAVKRELIETVINAARLAPSAKNRQPWKYIVYASREKDRLLDVMERSLLKEQETHALLPNSRSALADAFHTLHIMKTAPDIVIVMNTNGQNPFEPVDAGARMTEISDSLSIGASVENMLLMAADLGLGALWIANTCFAYHDLMEFIGEKGQLVGAVALGYADEQPPARPRKELSEVLEYR